MDECDDFKTFFLTSNLRCFVRVSPRRLHVLSLTYQTFGPRLILNCVTEPELSSAKLSPVIGPGCGAGTCSGTPGRLVPRWACRVIRDRLSKQIKGVRALKDGGGCFYVLPQAAVAPIGLGERLMGLKHSACSQMEGTRYRTSKCSVIYIFSQSNRHFSFFFFCSYQAGIRPAARLI